MSLFIILPADEQRVMNLFLTISGYDKVIKFDSTESMRLRLRAIQGEIMSLGNENAALLQEAQSLIMLSLLHNGDIRQNNAVELIDILKQS